MRRAGAGVGAALLSLVLLLAAHPGAASARVAPSTAESATMPPPLEVGGGGEEGLYHGTDPDRALKLYAPFAIVQHPRALDPVFKGVRLTVSGLELVQGGRLVRKVSFDARQPVEFEKLVRALATPDWIAEVEPGVFVLRAALVQGPSTSLRFTAPAVKEVRLATVPGVFIGGRKAQASFSGVKVTSWDLANKSPSEDISVARPFILYEEASRLDIASSDFGYLGSDRVASYGVSWREGGSTGEVTGSSFHHCFFGVYTYEARNIVFRNNVFHDNLYYGLDPHDGTEGLVVENNEAYGNGSHGIIFSRFVNNGIVRNNFSHDNGGSGIVMDYNSDKNLITGNRVEHNRLDGIVLLGSSSNEVSDNVVRTNRTGIRANQPGTANLIKGNRLEGNEVGIHAYGGASGLTLEGNQVVASRRTGIILDAPRTTLRGGTITGATRALEVRSTATVTDLTIKGTGDGVVVRPGATAALDKLDLTAGDIGIRVEAPGKALLRGSTVLADVATRGPVTVGEANRLSGTTRSTRTPWLALAGLVALVCAIILEGIVWRRDRREWAGALAQTST